MSNFDYKIDLSTYYPSNENKFNIYVDDMENLIAKNVSLPYVISITNWKSSYTIYLENLSDGCGEIREIILDGYVTTTTTLNFILTTTKYIPPTTLFTTTITTTTTSTTFTTITTQYVPPSTTTTTTQSIIIIPTTTSTTQPPVGYKVFYNNPKSITLQKNNCSGDGCVGTFVTYNVPYGKHSVTRLENSTSAQQEVDTIADQDINDNGQNYANNNGSCEGCTTTATYWNTQQIISKTRNDCSPCEGTSVNFIVGANLYSSNVSVNDANNIAINANQENAQINANANGQCVNCPNETVYYYNEQFFIEKFRNNCDSGCEGTKQFYLVLANIASSTINVADANRIARESWDSAAQDWANTFGGCINCPPPNPCDCKRGVLRNVGEYSFTNCQGISESGYIENKDNVIDVCIDISQSYFNVNVGGNLPDCQCS